MSRRIAIWVLAASATLTAGPATADRECFANLCQLPEAAAPPPVPSVAPKTADAVPPPQPAPTKPKVVQTAPPPSASAMAKDSDTTPPPAVPKMVRVMPTPLAPAAPKPVAPESVTPKQVNSAAGDARATVIDRAHPQMVVDPAPRPALLPKQRFGDETKGQTPLRPAPRYSEDAGPPARAAKRAPLPPVPAKAAHEATASVPPNAYAKDRAKVRAKDRAAVTEPHRLYGGYRIDRGVPVYVLAPDAKIITIDPEN